MWALIPWMGTLAGDDDIRDMGIWTSLSINPVFPMEDPLLAGMHFPYYIFGYYPKLIIGFFCAQLPAVSYFFAILNAVANFATATYLLFGTLKFKERWAMIAALGLTFGSGLQSVLLYVEKFFFHGPPYYELKVQFINSLSYLIVFPLVNWLTSLLHSDLVSFALLPLLLATLVELLWENKQPKRRDRFAAAILTGVLTGWIYGSHTWEVPLYAALFGLTLLLILRADRYREILMMGILASLTAAFVMLPFRCLAPPTHFHIRWVNEPTPLICLLRQWGLFLLPLFLSPVDIWRQFPKKRKPIGVVAGVAIAAAAFLPRTSLALLLGLFGYLGWTEKERPRKWGLLFAALAFAVTLAGELIFLEHGIMGKLNTVYRMSEFGWFLFGTSAFVLIHELKFVSGRRIRYALVTTWILLLFCHVSSVLKGRIFVGNRLHNPDGLQKIAARYPDDAKLISWMQWKTWDRELSGVILEAGTAKEDSGLASRFSGPVGLSSYLGIFSHAHYVGLHDNNPEIQRRQKKVGELFRGKENCESVNAALSDEKIDFVAIGEFERQQYMLPVNSPLENCLTLVHQEGNAKLLSVKKRK